MHFCPEGDTQYASTGVILSYMQMADVEQWKGTKVGRRGQDYEDFKREKAERLLDVLEEHFPNIRSQIQNYYTSTPLTYLDYTGTEGGSMYGNAKDISLGSACRVPQRTKFRTFTSLVRTSTLMECWAFWWERLSLAVSC